MDQKENFISSISHELRTPLNGIIGLSEALLVGSCPGLPPQVEKTIGTIKNSGGRLLNLINDLLDAATMRKVRWWCGLQCLTGCATQQCRRRPASCAVQLRLFVTSATPAYTVGTQLACQRNVVCVRPNCQLYVSLAVCRPFLANKWPPLSV